MSVNSKGRRGKNGTVYEIRLCANARTSRAVLKTEKLARTVPEESVPADSCASGAQWSPARSEKPCDESLAAVCSAASVSNKNDTTPA